jgi:hypothetical protein
MKKLIDKKFENISHKWFFIEIDSKNFNIIKEKIIIFVNENYNLKDEFKNLITHFKRNGFAWIKFIKYQGRNEDINFICQLITENDIKLEFNLDPKIIIESELLDGTPKSLNLFSDKINKKKNNWKKPDDGFNDNFSIPIDEELTEQGYLLYKDFHQELKNKNITLEQWHNQRGGPNWQKLPHHLKDLIN